MMNVESIGVSFCVLRDDRYGFIPRRDGLATPQQMRASPSGIEGCNVLV